MKTDTHFFTENIALLQESPKIYAWPGLHSYAQTNIQLYKQLKSVGYSFEEINHVRKAYDLAKELFSCLYCPSGKTYLAHVVGVGSILGSLRMSSNVVAASLLHDVYKSGDFGEGWNVDQKKSLVRQTIGLETEHYIEKYQDLEWSRFTISVIQNKITDLTPIEQDILMVRLAHELEGLLDGGILFCPDAESRQQHFRDLGHIHVEMAELLGHPTAAVEFDRAFKEIWEASSIRPLGSTGVKTSFESFRLIPLSYTYGFFAAIRNLMTQGIHGISRTLRLASMSAIGVEAKSSISAPGVEKINHSTIGR